MNRIIRGSVFACLCAVFLIGGSLPARAARAKTPAKTPAPAVAAAGISSLLDTQNVFTEVYRRVKPAVVQITTEKMVTYRYWNPFGDLDQFFGGQAPQAPKTLKRRQEGLGSGFIVEEDGYILTNNHVIEGVDKVQVKLSSSERKYDAKVIGTDTRTDLALIKISAGNRLPTVALGDSDAVEVGQWALAIGNPMGLDETLTVGIVSAKGRNFMGVPLDEAFVQTDAAINPGNSGGPLLNIRGEAIGINTFIIAPTEAQNIGFAIPINTAKRVFAQLKERGRVIRGFLGVYLQPMTEPLAKSFGRESTEGALVADVMSDSPAEKAGIKTGDVIVGFNETPVKDPRDLQSRVAEAKIGEKVDLGIWRDRKLITISLKMTEKPPEAKAAEKNWRGMQVANLTPDLRAQLNAPDIKGVAIVQVDSGSPADDAGLTAGLIIRSVDSTETSDVRGFQEAVAKVPAKQSALLLVAHNGANRWVTVPGE